MAHVDLFLKIDGVDVPVFTAARTIVDCFRFRNKIGLDVALEALKAKLNIPKSIREAGVPEKEFFAKLDEELKTFKWPTWLIVDPTKKEVKVLAEPSVDMTELLFDVRQVLEFYTR